MKRSWLAAGILVLGLWGCNNDSGKGSTVVSNEPSATTGGSAVTPGEPSKPNTDTTKPGTANPAPTSPKTGSTTLSTSNSNSDAKGPQKTSQKAINVDGLWKASSESPMDVAKGVDQRLSTLRNAAVRVGVFYQSDLGAGFLKSENTIKDDKTFSVEYPVLTNYRKKEITRNKLIANGSVAAITGGSGLMMRQPVNTVKMDTKTSLSDWVLNYPQLIFSPIRGGRPIEDLVTEAQKPNSGVTIVSEKVAFDYQGKTYHQKRLRFSKKSASGGPFDVVLSIDSDHELPVTIKALGGKSDSDKALVQWKADWNLHPHQPFDPALFLVPGVSKAGSAPKAITKT